MKKYLFTGIITAMALSLPLMSQAQTLPTSAGAENPIPTQPATGTYIAPPDTTNSQYQSPSSLQTGAQPVNPSMQTGQTQTSPYTPVGTQPPNPSMQQNSVSQSQSSASSTQIASTLPTANSGEVIIGTDSASSIVPQLSVASGTTFINVANPTPKAVAFTVPSLNLTYEVAANSERTIQIDRTQTASLTPGQVIAYYVNDASGNQVASSSLINNSSVASQLNTNSQVATESQNQQQSTASNSNASSSAPGPSAQRRSSVRGFW